MDYFADAVVQFNKRYPRVQFEVYSADGDDLKRYVDENKLDMAILIEPVESAKYTKIPIDVIEKWGLVVRNEEVPAKKKTLSYEEIIERTLILPRRYIVLSEISSWFKVPESKFKVAAYHNLASNALTMVEKESVRSYVLKAASQTVLNLTFAFSPSHLKEQRRT